MGFSEEDINSVNNFIGSWGYWAVFLGVLTGATGIPFPLVTLVLLSGFYASTGVLKYRYVIIIVAVAAITGHNIGYFVGRAFGRAFFVKYGRYFGVTPRRLAKVENAFARYGNKTILVAPFVWGLRSWIGPVCGISRVPFRTFLTYNAIAAVLWDMVITGIGYNFGEHREMLGKILDNVSLTLAVVVAVITVLYFRKRWLIGRENGAE